jgi:hypothetical protein
MRSGAASRTGLFLARLASLITLLALVVAPACAPLCAAQTCTQGHASTEVGCHSRGAANGGAVYLQAVQNCGNPELQAANLPSGDKRVTLKKVRASASRGELATHSADSSSLVTQNSARIDAVLESPPHSCCAISVAILRI